MTFRLHGNNRATIFGILAMVALVCQIFSTTSTPVLVGIFLLITAAVNCDIVLVTPTENINEGSNTSR